MRVVVFSDSHGNFNALWDVVRERADAGLFLFLGDGMREFEDLQALYPGLDLRCVRGNCDWGGERLFDLALCGGKRIFYTHGHTFGVKSSLEGLVAAARRQGADVALYGHTHIAMTGYRDGLHLMNPGSTALPRGGPASYGIVDITPAGIVTQTVPMERKGSLWNSRD